jgi:hypothetical protein
MYWTRARSLQLLRVARDIRDADGHPGEGAAARHLRVSYQWKPPRANPPVAGASRKRPQTGRDCMSTDTELCRVFLRPLAP